MSKLIILKASSTQIDRACCRQSRVESESDAQRTRPSATQRVASQRAPRFVDRDAAAACARRSDSRAAEEAKAARGARHGGRCASAGVRTERRSCAAGELCSAARRDAARCSRGCWSHRGSVSVRARARSRSRDESSLNVDARRLRRGCRLLGASSGALAQFRKKKERRVCDALAICAMCGAGERRAERRRRRRRPLARRRPLRLSFAPLALAVAHDVSLVCRPPARPPARSPARSLAQTRARPPLRAFRRARVRAVERRRYGDEQSNSV